jgi:hypothetical protein
MAKITLFFIFLVVFLQKVYSQCTDAGICTIGKYSSVQLKSKNSAVSFGYIYGYSGQNPDLNGALNDITYGSLKLDADFDILKDSRLLFSIPYTFATGTLGEVNGLGDLLITFTKSITVKKEHVLSFSLGGKFATGKVNSDDSLPQRYMPSLGTNDLMIGANYNYQSYNAGIAYQKPFGRSANYVTRLKRGDDLLFRAGYTQILGNLSVKAEILTILVIQNSSVLDPVGGGESFVVVDGTNEPQVNLLAVVNYLASKNILLSGFGAIPFLQRDYNYDGTKRTLSLGASFSYLFSIK